MREAGKLDSHVLKRLLGYEHGKALEDGKLPEAGFVSLSKMPKIVKSLDSKGLWPLVAHRLRTRSPKLIVDGELRLEQPAKKEKEPIVKRQNTAAGRLDGC